MNIVRLDRAHLGEMYRENEPFEIFGRVKPVLADGRWSYAEELFDSAYTKTYPTEQTDYTAYIDSEDRAVFLTYDKDRCIGRIVMRRNWNRYAFVEEVAVAKDYRCVEQVQPCLTAL